MTSAIALGAALALTFAAAAIPASDGPGTFSLDAMAVVELSDAAISPDGLASPSSPSARCSIATRTTTNSGPTTFSAGRLRRLGAAHRFLLIAAWSPDSRRLGVVATTRRPTPTTLLLIRRPVPYAAADDRHGRRRVRLASRRRGHRLRRAVAMPRSFDTARRPTRTASP